MLHICVYICERLDIGKPTIMSHLVNCFLLAQLIATLIHYRAGGRYFQLVGLYNEAAELVIYERVGLSSLLMWDIYSHSVQNTHAMPILGGLGQSPPGNFEKIHPLRLNLTAYLVSYYHDIRLHN